MLASRGAEQRAKHVAAGVCVDGEICVYDDVEAQWCGLGDEKAASRVKLRGCPSMDLRVG